MKKLLVVLGTAFAAITITCPAWAGGYQFQFVDYPGAPQTAIFGINNPGMAVGYGFGFNNITAINFQYDTKKKAFTVIPSVSGYDETDILGINNAGIMSGASLPGTPMAAGPRAESSATRTAPLPYSGSPTGTIPKPARSTRSASLRGTRIRPTATALLDSSMIRTKTPSHPYFRVQ